MHVIILFLNRLASDLSKTDQRSINVRFQRNLKENLKDLSRGRHASTFILLDSSSSFEGIILLDINRPGYIALQGGNKIKQSTRKYHGNGRSIACTYDDITSIEKTTEGKESSIFSVVWLGFQVKPIPNRISSDYRFFIP